MKLIKFPSIGQYRNTVYNVMHKAQFVKFGEDGEPVINKFAKMPKLSFEGTVKIHGTNGSIVVSKETYTQSRRNIITPEKDNAGFSAFIYKKHSFFNNLAKKIKTSEPNIIFYGEFCGKGIQKGVAVSELQKFFVIFSVVLADENGIYKKILSKDEVKDLFKNNEETGIYTSYDFETYQIEIDFENPAESQNKLNEITNLVEKCCPVGKSFGVDGVGEGVVWRCTTPGYEESAFWFKVKGEKHSKSKVKTLARVDTERVNSIKKLAGILANNERLEQMHQEVFDTLNGGTTDIKKMGSFIKSVMTDIFKEEIDLIAENGFTGKELSAPVARICREFIMKKLKTFD